MCYKVFVMKRGNEEYYIDPVDYPNLNLVGGEMIDRNDPKVVSYFSSPERVKERERLIKFSEEVREFFKDGNFKGITNV